jgi:hypothetical protein
MVLPPPGPRRNSNHKRVLDEEPPMKAMRASERAGFRLRATSRSYSGDDWSRRSVPEILEPLAVASLGLAATDADHVETFRAGLERADDCRSDTQHVPR